MEFSLEDKLPKNPNITKLVSSLYNIKVREKITSAFVMML